MRDPIFLLPRHRWPRERDYRGIEFGDGDRNLSCGLRKMIPERVKRVKPQAASHCGGAISLGTVRRWGVPLSPHLSDRNVSRDWECNAVVTQGTWNYLGSWFLFSEIVHLFCYKFIQFELWDVRDVFWTLRWIVKGRWKISFSFLQRFVCWIIIIGVVTGSVNLSSYHVIATNKEYLFGSLWGKIDSLLVYEVYYLVYFLGKQKVLTFPFVPSNRSIQ